MRRSPVLRVRENRTSSDDRSRGAAAISRAPADRWLVPATCGTLAAALLLQLVFYRRGGSGSLSDLPHLFVARGIRRGAFPYVDRPLEYPVGAGLLLYGATLAAPSAFGILLITAAAASALCVWITTVLHRHVGHRAWRWALAPAVALYAFQNWDVFALAAMVFGLLAFERHRDGLAGAALGLGAAVKLFPAFVLVPLVAIRWAAGDRRGAARVAGTGILTFAALNLPILIANPQGWWWPYAFQSRRQATWGTVWFYGFRALEVPVHGHLGAQIANAAALLALGVGLAWLSVVTVRRHVPAMSGAAAAVAIFVVTGKVYSPTYDLWLVVFFVLLPLSTRTWRAFVAVDLGVFVVVYGSFHGFVAPPVLHVVLPLLVAIRAVVLVVFLRAATRPAHSSAPQVVGANVLR